MSAVDSLFMWLSLISCAATGDALWVHRIRPALAPRFGWRDLDPDELIPAKVWIGALAVLALFFVFVPFVGAAAGY